MAPPCALCAGKPDQAYSFPGTKKPEIQEQWVDALGLPPDKRNSILKEMRDKLNSGEKPKWCAGHFGMNSEGQLLPKYFNVADAPNSDESDEDEEKNPSAAVPPSTSAIKTEPAAETKCEPEEKVEMRRDGRPRRSTAAKKPVYITPEEPPKKKKKSLPPPEAHTPTSSASSMLSRVGLGPSASSASPLMRKTQQKNSPKPILNQYKEGASSLSRLAPVAQNTTSQFYRPPHRNPLSQSATIPKECTCKSEIDVIVERTMRMVNNAEELAADLTTLIERSSSINVVRMNRPSIVRPSLTRPSLPLPVKAAPIQSAPKSDRRVIRVPPQQSQSTRTSLTGPYTVIPLEKSLPGYSRRTQSTTRTSSRELDTLGRAAPSGSTE